MVLSQYLSSLFLPALAFLSLSARASPHPRMIPRTATLKLSVGINSNGIKNIAAADRARFQALSQSGGSSSIDASNAQMTYSTDIGVGTPPTYCKFFELHFSFLMKHLFHADTLLVDTGSSNTWIGASKPYEITSTSKDTGGQFVSIHEPYLLFTITTTITSRALHTVI
jgi:hypothetical protein